MNNREICLTPPAGHMLWDPRCAPAPARGLVRWPSCGLGPGQVRGHPRGGDAEPRMSFTGAHRPRAPQSFGPGQLWGWWHWPALGGSRTQERNSCWSVGAAYGVLFTMKPKIPNTDDQHVLSHQPECLCVSGLLTT